MITTVTTTTVVALQQVAVVTALGVVVLIATLVINELLSSAKGKRRMSSLAQRLKIVTFPLLFVFALIIVMKIWEVI